MAAARRSPKLTAARRRSLPASDFALPGKDPNVPGAKGQYPMDTIGRARDALSRAAQDATPAQQATIRQRVKAKYPSIDAGGKTTGKTAGRKTTTARKTTGRGRSAGKGK